MSYIFGNEYGTLFVFQDVEQRNSYFIPTSISRTLDYRAFVASLDSHLEEQDQSLDLDQE